MGMLRQLTNQHYSSSRDGFASWELREPKRMASGVQPLNRHLPLRHAEVEPEMAHAITVSMQVYGLSLVALVATGSVIASNSEAIVEAAVFRDRDQVGTRHRTT